MRGLPPWPRRELRADATDAEMLLWRRLRGRQLEDWKFRRQHPLGPFIVDFFCSRGRLAIEIDGGQHFEEEAQRYDAERSRFLERCGIEVLRFNNDQVLAETDAVLEVIASFLRARRSRGA
jgi:very-short-patch-repair endonuclease